MGYNSFSEFSMEPLDNRKLDNPIYQPTDKIHLHNLPTDLLITIFSRLKTFDEMITWGSTCRKFRQIFHHAKNWEHAIPFEKMLHQRGEFKDWRKFQDILFGHINEKTLGIENEKEEHFSRELATLFFNHADEDILDLFIVNLARKKTTFIKFLDLLIPEKLERTTFKTWAKYIPEIEYHPLKLLPFIKGLKHLKIMTQNVNDENLKILAQLPELETLFICECDMTEATLQIICGLKNLKSLELGNPLKVPLEKFSLLETSQIEYFTLARHFKIKDEHLKFLENMPALKVFQALNSRLLSKEFIRKEFHKPKT